MNLRISAGIRGRRLMDGSIGEGAFCTMVYYSSSLVYIIILKQHFTRIYSDVCICTTSSFDGEDYDEIEVYNSPSNG